MPPHFLKRFRFAPLDPQRKINASSIGDRIPLQGVIFDVDGTLCKPQSYMFREMRSHLSIPPTTDILTHISTLPPSAQPRALAAIRAIEARAMLDQEPQPGLDDLMGYLRGKELRLGVCTRNFDGPVAHLLGKFLPAYTFSPIVTRDFHPPKPHPAGILHIAAEWGLEGAEGLIMVGDSLDDMTAGYRAGAATVLLVRDGNEELKEHEHTGMWIERLDELVGVLESGGEERDGDGDGGGDGDGD